MIRNEEKEMKEYSIWKCDFFECSYWLWIIFLKFHFLLFKNTLSSKKQRSITANPARKLSVESAEYPWINNLRDKTAIRMSVIPIIGIICFGNDFFIWMIDMKWFDMKTENNYWPKGFWLLQLTFSPGETLKYLQKYL